jgi:hypothetical protein
MMKDPAVLTGSVSASFVLAVVACHLPRRLIQIPW